MIQVSHPKIRAQNSKIQNYAPQFEVLEVQILHAPQSEVQSEVQSEFKYDDVENNNPKT